MTYTILLPTDGSVPALAATVKAVELAKEWDAILAVLKVVEQEPMTYTERVAESAALQRPVEEDGTAYAISLADSNSVKHVLMVREGAVAGEIIRGAKEINANLIVMGKSSPRGISRLYFGDVAEAVVSHAPCTVLVVKPTEKEIEIARALISKRVEPETAKVVGSITKTKRFKVGLYLFSAYVIGYAAFTLSGTYFRLTSGGFFGTNTALLSGIALILIAIIMAIGFNWYADRQEKAEAK